MRINHLYLKNFKCFREETTVNFSKITLLTGENSSGKSSLIFGILGALQSEFPFELSPNGKYVEMGDFREISFAHNIESTIEIGFELSEGREKYRIWTAWKANPRTRLPELDHLKITTKELRLEITRKEKYVVNAVWSGKAIQLSKSAQILKEAVEKLVSTDIWRSIYKESALTTEEAQQYSESLSRKDVVGLEIKNIDDLRPSLYDTKNLYLVFHLDSIRFGFNGMNNIMNYVSSFRLQPERTYYQRMTDSRVGRHGENTIDQILAWRSRQSGEFRELVSALRNMRLLDSMTIRKLGGGRFEPRVEIRTRGPWASLADVGFGISQFLPIIVGDIQLPEGSTLLVSQPEIHLHPSVQADIADYFINSVRRKNKRYILETHSEYLMNRIRKAIVKEILKPEEVAVYYFENAANGTKLHRVMFGQHGEVENAPKGFFDTYQMEIMDIALSF